jgi:hypothetical protein
MAQLRDNGKSLGYALKLLVDVNPTIGPQMFQTFEYIAAYVYDRPWLQPDAVQQEMQTHCLQTSDIAPLERLKGNSRYPSRGRTVAPPSAAGQGACPQTSRRGANSTLIPGTTSCASPPGRQPRTAACRVNA